MLLRKSLKRQFGILREYKERIDQKMLGTHKILPSPKFFITPTRPSNFGDHLDLKVTIDNWFEENRIHNEGETDIRRTQIYLVNTLGTCCALVLARFAALMMIGRLSGWKRYDRDTYLELDVSIIPPGEVVQIVWNGTPVFVRRISNQEYDEEMKAHEHQLLDPKKPVNLNQDINSRILCVSAICTHLGCIPIPYLGPYGGWVCICHGSVFDKLARVRQGPALENLRTINNTLHGEILCIEELKFPREPTTRFYT